MDTNNQLIRVVSQSDIERYKKEGIKPEEMPLNLPEKLQAISNYPTLYYKHLKVANFKQIFDSDHCSIGLIKREKSEMTCRAFLVIAINDLIKFFNVGKTMNEYQVADTADLIIDDYYFLSIDDLKFCFTNAKKGIYGAVYDCIDGRVILEWIGKYLNDRLKSADEIEYKNHAQIKATEKSAPSFQEIVENRKNLARNWKQK